MSGAYPVQWEKQIDNQSMVLSQKLKGTPNKLPVRAEDYNDSGYGGSPAPGEFICNLC